jgi:AraC-like DNA-binding protein
MFADDHLTLRLVRVKETEPWQPSGAGLCFLFIRGGTGKCVAEPVNQRLGAGDVLVLNAAAGGHLVAAGAGEFAFSHFAASVEDMFPLFSVNEISLLQQLVENFKGMKLYSAGSPLAVECQRLAGIAPPQFGLDHRSHLLGVVAAVLGEEFKTLQSQRRGSGFVSMEQHLLQVFEKLTAHDLLHLSAGELADKFGCSRRHLNRLFHQYFGFSIAALRMEMRMLKAVSLLRETEAKIINVAEQCGFNHLGLFNTCFKRRFGSSPGQWRSKAAPTPAPAAANGDAQPPCPLQTNGLCPMLGGPAIAGVPAQRHAQLRTVALSAVLAKPASPTNSSHAHDARPARLNGHPDRSGGTTLQVNG